MPIRVSYWHSAGEPKIPGECLKRVNARCPEQGNNGRPCIKMLSHPLCLTVTLRTGSAQRRPAHTPSQILIGTLASPDGETQVELPDDGSDLEAADPATPPSRQHAQNDAAVMVGAIWCRRLSGCRQQRTDLAEILGHASGGRR